MSCSTNSIDCNKLTCAACVSQTCKEPLWKDDLIYTGHSQVPSEKSEVQGACCCEKIPEHHSCKNCSKANGVSWDVRQLLQTKSIRSNICKYKEKVKEKSGICSVM